MFRVLLCMYTRVKNLKSHSFTQVSVVKDNKKGVGSSH